MSKGTYKRLRRNGRLIDEHRWVWQQAHGPIPEGYEIHHKNGKKRDNRLENLVLMEIGKHRSMHARRPPRLCAIDGCDAPHESAGFCKRHWCRWRRTGNPLGVRGPGRGLQEPYIMV